MFDLLFQSATVVDGNGEPPVTADVGIRAGRIAAIGNWVALARARPSMPAAPG